MLLKVFKRTGPLTIFLIVVILLLLWAGAFIKAKEGFSWYFDLNPMPLYGLLSSLIGTNPVPGIIFSFLLVSLMAFLMVNLNTTLFFINERTFLPALIYILMSGLFPHYQLMNPAIIAAVFLMLAIRRIMESYRVAGMASNFFDAGILIGTGSLFYADLVWFWLIVIIGIALLRTGNVKEIILSVVGVAAPFILTAGFYYVTGKDPGEFFSALQYNIFGRQDQFAFTPMMIVAVIYTAGVTLLGIAYLFMHINSKKIQARKTFSLLLWVFLISVTLFIVFPSVSVEIIWIAAIPVSYYMSHYFVFVKKKLVPGIIFSLLFLLVMLMQAWYLKDVI